MKKILSFIFVFLLLIGSGIAVNASTYDDWSGVKELKKYQKVDTEFRAVWVCTVGNMDVKRQTDASPEAIEEWKKQYIEILDNAQDNNLNTIIFQIRPCNDAFYPSKYNAWSQYLCGYGKDPGWDPLEWMLEVTHERGMEYHAWMNPYRVTTSASESITMNTGGSNESVYDYNNEELQAAKQKVFGNLKNIAKANGTKELDNPTFLEGEELEYNVVLGTESKYVLNPASEKTIEHLKNTIREVVENYDIDGIHFDDYFYPNDCSYVATGSNPNFKNLTFSTESLVDYADYTNYKKNGGTLSIYDWRRENVNILIKSLGEVIDEVNKDKDIQCAFGISPAARWAPSIEACPAGSPRGVEGGMDAGCNNYYSYSDLFADTKKWVDEEWIDYLLPQVYTQLSDSYEDIIEWWSDAMKDSPVKLYSGTPLYQVDTWGNVDEIYYQVRYNQSEGNRVDGYALFRYINMENGKGKNALNMVVSGLWTTNALTPLYEGFEYKHDVSSLASINEKIEVSETEIRLKYEEIQDAKAYILYKTNSKQVSDLDASDMVRMNLKNKGYFDIIYDESYTYYLATVSEDNTIYIDENPISFDNVIENKAPVINLESKFPSVVLIETELELYFSIVDPEGAEVTYEVKLVDGSYETIMSTSLVDGKVYLKWETPFVSYNNLKFVVTAYDGVKTSKFETELFDVLEECPHSYTEATCETPAKCIYCNKTKGSALGHSYVDATCEKAKECTVCGKIEGEALGHDYSRVTCENDAVCSRCKDISQKALGHDWIEATKKTPKTCSECGKTEGEPLKGCKKANLATIIIIINTFVAGLLIFRKRGN